MIYYEFDGDVCVAKYNGFKPSESVIGIEEDYPIELVRLNRYKMSDKDPAILALKPTPKMTELESHLFETIICMAEDISNLESKLNKETQDGN